jgi:hypothetical protein
VDGRETRPPTDGTALALTPVTTMRLRPATLSVLLVATSVACFRAPPADPGAAPVVPSSVVLTVPSPAAVYPHCPPAAGGADTVVQDVAGGVALDVTGNDLDGSADIRARTQELLGILERGRSEIRHTGEGDGPGFGRCPIVLHDATITVVPIDRGERFVVTTAPSEVEWLRHETRARLFELRVPTSSGGHGMDHCPSSLPAATTEVTDSDEGVSVLVTSRAPEVTEAIRGRAWHVSEESRHPGAHAEHAPAAASIHACPVVLEDTDVTATDVPGGSLIVVRARFHDEVAGVRRVAHERARALP